MEGTAIVEVTKTFFGDAAFQEYGEFLQYLQKHYDVAGNTMETPGYGRVAGTFWVNMTNADVAEYAARSVQIGRAHV